LNPPENSDLSEEVQVITSAYRELYYTTEDLVGRSELHSTGWHSDVSFEKAPSDYAFLKIHTLPPSGGDTLWASGYEVYDRLTPAFRTFLEGLTATHNANFFKGIAKARGQSLYPKARGSALNIGTEDLSASHPVIRTNPVTGWKAVFVNPNFTIKINELSNDESKNVLDHLYKLITENHDLQVRFKWNKNDVALWDNRSTFHTATNDFPDSDLRVGDRSISTGEKPYLDPQSLSRREALGIKTPITLRKYAEVANAGAQTA
jgi:alpha-ketoglutarate-dependent taurine dioxygenase